jgi:hypothetical protein
MKTALSILPALVLAAALSAVPGPALANCGSNGKDVGNGCMKGAPAPLLGAGLSGLVIGGGYGAYWLARRRRKMS